jgi:hypothetical protein
MGKTRLLKEALLAAETFKILFHVFSKFNGCELSGAYEMPQCFSRYLCRRSIANIGAGGARHRMPILSNFAGRFVTLNSHT